jgi:hypothetical protein
MLLLLAAPALSAETRLRVLLGLAAAVVAAGFAALAVLAKYQTMHHVEQGHSRPFEEHLLKHGEGEVLLDGSPPAESDDGTGSTDSYEEYINTEMEMEVPTGRGGGGDGPDDKAAALLSPPVRERGTLARLAIITFNLVVVHLTWLAALLVLGLSLRFRVAAAAGSFFSSQLPTVLIVCFNAFTFAGNLAADRWGAKGLSEGGGMRQTGIVYGGLALEGGCAVVAVVLALRDGSVPGGRTSGVLLLFGLYAVIAFCTGAQCVLHSSAAQETCARRDAQLGSVAGTAVWAAVQSGVMVGIIIALVSSSSG